MCSFYLREFYLENNLSRGNLSVSGKPLDLMSIREPLYVVASEQDHISPWKSVYNIAGLVKCPVRLALPNEGHITGIVNPPSEYSRRVFRLNNVSPGLTPEQWLEGSPECQGSWWPDWVSWLTQRSGAQKKARPAGSAKYPQLDPAPGRYVLEK
jgi:polyhydroxyalkanoate synthase